MGILRDRNHIILLLLLVIGTTCYFSINNYNNQIGGVAELDGYYYYIYLRSMQVDGDLDFANEYEKWGNQFGFGKSQTGRHRNIFGVGPALLWLPFFLVTHLLAIIGVKLGYPISLDGMSRFHQVGTFYGSMIYGWLAVVLCYLTACRVFGKRHALWPALGAALAGPLPCYVMTLASFSHAQAAMTTSLLVWLWIRWRDRWTPRRWLVWGAVVGLMLLVRPACLPFVLLPVMEGLRGLWAPLRARQGAAAARALAAPAAGAAVGVLVFSPQLFVWKHLFGSYLTVPQGEGFMIWTESAWASTLFSPRNGLFTMAPLMALGVLGLFGATIRRTALAAPMIVILAGMAVINGMAHDWWGWGFSARRFTSALPLLTFGLGAALAGIRWGLERKPSRSIAAVTALVIIAPILFNLQWFQNYIQQFMTWTNLRSSQALYMTVMNSLSERTYKAVGNPMSLPASIPFSLNKGGSPALFDRLDGHYLLGESHALANPSARPYAHSTMVLSDLRYRFNLSESFGYPIEHQGITYVPIRKPRGHVFLPINRISTLHIRIGGRAHFPGTRLEVKFNGARLTLKTLPGRAWGMVTVKVPEELVEQGINRMDLIHHMPRGWDRPGHRRVGTTGVNSPVDVAVVSGGLAAGNFTEIWVAGRKVSNNGRGYNVAVLDRKSGEVLGTKVFDVIYRPVLHEELGRYLERFPGGSIVALGARDNVGKFFGRDAGPSLALFGAVTDLGKLERSGYAAIGVLGAPPGTAMENNEEKGHARVSVGRPPPPWREVAQYRFIQLR